MSDVLPIAMLVAGLAIVPAVLIFARRKGWMKDAPEKADDDFNGSGWNGP